MPMNRELVIKYRQLFEGQKQHLLHSRGIVDQDFQIQADDLLDEADMTSSELETSMRMRLRSREALFLKKINEALGRIIDGSFGICVSCEDEIELRRLEARPTATHCVHCKEEQERLEHGHVDGRRPKSLGHKLRFA